MFSPVSYSTFPLALKYSFTHLYILLFYAGLHYISKENIVLLIALKLSDSWKTYDNIRKYNALLKGQANTDSST